MRRGDWLVLALARVLTELGRGRPTGPRAVRERVAAELVALYEANRSYALAPIALGRAAGVPAPP